MTVAELDAQPADAARSALERCCGARRWVEHMLAARPFGSPQALHAASDAAWAACDAQDQLEAFEHHPRIGDLRSLAERFASTREWANSEQSGVVGAEQAVLERLARGNADYEARFGYRFIVCATGLTAAEMLARLESRMHHDPGTERGIAAAEQHRITRLRLEKLLA